jgi:hypothetical protein
VGRFIKRAINLSILALAAAVFFLLYQSLTRFELSEWLAIPLALAAAYFVTRMAFKDDPIIRGQRKLNVSDAQDLAAKRRGEDDKGFLFGGVALPSTCKNKGLLYLGAPSSGKSLSIKHAMLQAFGDLIGGGKGKTRGIIFDFKMEFVPYLKSLGIPQDKISLFHCNHKESVQWDIQADIWNIKDAISVAHAFIPENPKETNPYFTNGARVLLGATLQAFYLRAREKPGLKWTLRDVFLALDDEDAMRELFKPYPATRGALKYLGRGNNDVLSTLEGFVRPAQILAAVWGDKKPFSIRKWMDKEEGGILILGNDQSDPFTSQALARVLFGRIGQALLSGKKWGEERTTWFFFDEFPQMSHLTNIENFIPTVRAYGGNFVLGVQSIPQLYLTYGEHLAKVILELCGTKAIFHVEQESAAYASKQMIGSYELREKTTSIQYRMSDSTIGEGENIRERAAIHETEIAGLPLADSTNPFVTGFYLSSSLENRVWRHQTRFRDFGDASKYRNDSDEQPEDDPKKFEITDWTPEERKKFELPDRKEAPENPEPGPQQSPQEPRPRRRVITGDE